MSEQFIFWLQIISAFNLGALAGALFSFYKTRAAYREIFEAWESQMGDLK